MQIISTHNDGKRCDKNMLVLAIKTLCVAPGAYNFVAIPIHLFNSAHTFTVLQMEIILMLLTYCNNSKNIEK